MIRIPQNSIGNCLDPYSSGFGILPVRLSWLPLGPACPCHLRAGQCFPAGLMGWGRAQVVFGLLVYSGVPTQVLYGLSVCGAWFNKGFP